jgi:hypothetical protein
MVSSRMSFSWYLASYSGNRLWAVRILPMPAQPSVGIDPLLDARRLRVAARNPLRGKAIPSLIRLSGCIGNPLFFH